LVDGARGIEGVAALVDVRELHGGPDGERAAVGGLGPGDHAEQGGLAGTVRADDADDARSGQLERQVFDEEAVAIALAEVLGLDDDVAETVAGRDRYLEAIGAAVGG